MSKLLQLAFPPFPGIRSSIGLVVLRLLTGFGIFLHGYGKLSQGPDFFAGFANGVGVPVFMVWLAVLAETVGGLLILLGLVSPLAALMLVGNMAFAVKHHIGRGDPFLLNSTGEGTYTVGFEFASLYLVAFFALLLAGPGRFSFDYFFFKKYTARR